MINASQLHATPLCDLRFHESTFNNFLDVHEFLCVKDLDKRYFETLELVYLPIQVILKQKETFVPFQHFLSCGPISSTKVST